LRWRPIDLVLICTISRPNELWIDNSHIEDGPLAFGRWYNSCVAGVRVQAGAKS
jgi:hypothetical protein